MTTIKSYTDIEQSKKLAEILPLESADMMYQEYETVIGDDYVYTYRIQPFFSSDIDGIPCWSLAALLNYLPFPVLYMEMVAGMILWCCESHFIETDEMFKIEHYDNPIDACYEMILKLNELNLL